MTHTDPRKTKKIVTKNPRPITNQQLNQANTQEPFVYLTWVYSWEGEDYYWTTQGYWRNETNFFGNFPKVKKNTLNFELKLDRPIKSILYNGFNSLLTTRINYRRIPHTTSNVYQRVAKKSDNSRIATLYATGAWQSGMQVLDANTMQFVSFVGTAWVPSAVMRYDWLNEVVLTSSAWDIFWIDENTGLQIWSAITGIGASVALLQDTNYIYVLSSTQLRRIVKNPNPVNRVVDPIVISHGVGSANKMEFFGWKIWIVWSTDARSVDPALWAWSPLWTLITGIVSWWSGTWLLPTPTRLFVVSGTNYNQIREINTLTNTLSPYNTELPTGITNCFYWSGKICVGNNTSWRWYSDTPNAVGQLDHLYTTNVTNTGQIDSNPSIGQLTYPLVMENAFWFYLWLHDTSILHKIDLGGQYTINGVVETRQSYDLATPTDTLTIEATGWSESHDLYPNINLVVWV